MKRGLRRRYGRTRSTAIWYEPAGGLLEEGWYATGPHGRRMGPYDSEEIAAIQLRRARGW